MPVKARILKINTGKTSFKGRVLFANTIKQTIRGKIKVFNSKALSSQARIAGVGTTFLHLPIDTSLQVCPISFEWHIPPNKWDEPLNFQLQIDKTDDTFGDLELEKFSYKDSGFEYYNGSGWVTLPTSGVANSYAGNLARYITTLTYGLKHWRVRAFAG
jgi:hypothetical protein